MSIIAALALADVTLPASSVPVSPAAAQTFPPPPTFVKEIPRGYRDWKLL